MYNSNISDYKQFNDKFPIRLTRKVEAAKAWLRARKAESKSRYESNRIGILMSAKAFRLRPFGFDIKKVGIYDNVAKWFLDNENSIESSDFLEVALSEFFVQGLEVDYTGVIWDADLIDVDSKGWTYYSGFNGVKWTGESYADKNETELTENQRYQKNAYRVLLTRARRGMIICVPEGDESDPTRPSKNYDPTYNYLKSLGIEEI